MTSEQILLILRSSKDFVSGEQISSTLGISRTAVWKAINRLKSQGYSIQSVPHQGYRFLSAADILTGNELHAVSQTKWLGKQVVYSRECLSTNNEAKAGGLGGDPEGTVYITDSQTQGRGRMGREWHSAMNEGIAMSILLRPMVSPSQIMPVSLLAGLSISKALEELTGLPCQVKWPNDVIINGRKIAGVLIEMSTIGEMVQFVVLGAGLNVNNQAFPEEIRTVATSLFLETGRKWSRKAIVCKILECFEQDYMKWISEMDESGEYPSDSSVASYLSEYKSRCVNLGKEVTVHQNGHDYTGTAKDITPEGELLLVLPNGKERVVMSGEVSVRGIYGYA